MPPNGPNKLALSIIGGLAVGGILGAVGVYGQQRAMEPRLVSVEAAAQNAQETHDKVIAIEKDIGHISEKLEENQDRNDAAHKGILDELKKR